MGIALALSKIKKMCCKLNHSTLSSAIIEALSNWHKFTPRGKIFSVLWSTVVQSELLGRSSMDGFFPTAPKPVKMVFDDIWHLTWLALSFLRRILTASETDERHWHDVHVSLTVSCMTCDVSGLDQRFSTSPEVMLFFFCREYKFSFLTFLAYKIVL